MMNDVKQPPSTPKFGFLLDELHRQGFIVGVGDMLKVHRYFTSLWEYPVSAPLSIVDLKAQLAALICQNPQQQKQFYEWFDKWASIIEKRTENLIAQLEPLEAEKTAAKDKPVEAVEKPHLKKVQKFSQCIAVAIASHATFCRRLSTTFEEPPNA